MYDTCMYMPYACANLNWQLKLQLVLFSRRGDSWMDTAGTAVRESKPIAGLAYCSISLSGLIAIPVMMECTLPALWQLLFVQRECGSLVVPVGRDFCPTSQESPMKRDQWVSLPPESACQASLSSRLLPLAAATDTNTSQAAPLLKIN